MIAYERRMVSSEIWYRVKVIAFETLDPGIVHWAGSPRPS